MSGDGRAAVPGLARGLLFVFVAALCLFSAHSPETWLRLRSGAELAAGGLTAEDRFSYTAEGRPWHPHDWLSDLLSHAVVSWAGEGALVVLKELVAASGFALVAGLNPAEPVLAAGVLAFAACGAWPGLTELPGMFDFLLLAFLLRTLGRARGFDGWLLAKVFLIEALWANLHPAGAMLGLALVLLKCFDAAWRTDLSERRGWAALAVAAAVAIQANPWGLETCLHLLSEGAGQAGPQWPPPPGYWGIHGFFIAAGAAASWLCLQEEFFLAVATAVLLALSVVSPGWAPLAMAPAGLLVSLAIGQFARLGPGGPRVLGGLCLWLAALFAAYFGRVGGPLSGTRGFTSLENASGAVAWLDANDVRGRMFNDLGIAPYLVLKAPDRPVFVDPRPGVYEPEFLQDALLWPERWRAMDSAYQFDYAVLENRLGGYPCRALDEDPGWILAYFDDSSLVYLRVGGGSSALAGLDPAWGGLRPNNLFMPVGPGMVEDPASAQAVLNALESARLSSKDAITPLLMRAWVLDRLGRPGEASEVLKYVAGRRLWKPDLAARYGAVLEARGDAKTAIAAYESALAWALRSGDKPLGSMVSARLGSMRLKLGLKRQAGQP